MTLREKIEQKKKGILSQRLRSRRNDEREKLVIHFDEDEREKAEYLLISAVQSIHFEAEIVSLLKLGIFSPNALKDMKLRTSKLTSLSPFLDENNVLRAGGRCGKAEYLPYDIRYPMILPNHQDENVRALIRGYHIKAMHCSKTQTFYLLRQKYFILGGKTTVSNVLSSCITCQRLSKHPERQREGDLPVERIEVAAPFSNSGVDVFGPYHLRHKGRGTKKTFVLMVCCMTTRAVALYALRDMTTSAMINALVKMNAQFPALKKIFSDQGSNFRGADREIREAVHSWNKNELNSELQKIGVTWIFGPAYCGSAGGAWERLIGMTKKLLKSVIGGKTIDQDDFETLLAGASGIMNRRPLMPASANADDDLVLSPAHFLYPYLFVNSASHILPPCADEPERLRHGWRSSQALLDDFWDRFKREYLQTLIKRRKTDASDEIRPGDLVLIVDPGGPREDWRLARVLEVVNTELNRARRFIVRDSNNHTFDRAITGLIKIRVDKNNI